MRRELAGSVIVIVGASSGVGRATALAFAEHHAKLVLTARNEHDLATLVQECCRLGTAAVAVPGDVASARDLENVRRRANEAFGRIDTWVNCAAVIIAGRVEDQPVDAIERLVRTNVLGTTLASRTALEQFRSQRHGVLINVSSLLGVIQNPLVPTYVMSKYAVRGLSLALHHATTSPRIRVCTILPGPIDTPTFQRAANHLGRMIRAVPPACAPERVAAAIVASARRPRRVRIVGLAGRTLALAHRAAPVTTEWAAARITAALLVKGRPAEASNGGLFEWNGGGQVHGGWRRGRVRRRLGEALGKALSRRGATFRAHRC